MKSLAIRIVAFFIIFCLVIPTVGVSAAVNALSLSMSYSGDNCMGGEINLKITVSKPSVALAGLEFILYYDADYVSPLLTVNTEDGKEMDALVEKMPSDWEQMSYHSSEEAFYHFRFATSQQGNSYLDSAGELVLNIPFTVIGAGSFEFEITDSDIIAIAADDDFTSMSGTGTTLPMVAYSEAQKAAITFESGDTTSENALYNLNIKATNLGDADGIIALQFVLEYDKTVFEPTVKKNDELQMDVFMTDMPKNAWEQMCSLDEENGKYTLRFSALHSESLTQAEALVSGDSLMITIPFKVIGSEGDVGNFSVPAASVIALSANNKILEGRGTTKTVAVQNSVNSFIPEELGYTIKDGCLMYVAEKTSVSSFLTLFNGYYLTDANGTRITDGNVCSGYILTDGANTKLSVVVMGDADCNGEISSTDYLFAKRACLGSFVPTTLQKYAMAIVNQTEITSADYLFLKRHCLGTYNINRV